MICWRKFELMVMNLSRSIFMTRERRDRMNRDFLVDHIPGRTMMIDCCRCKWRGSSLIRFSFKDDHLNRQTEEKNTTWRLTSMATDVRQCDLVDLLFTVVLSRQESIRERSELVFVASANWRMLLIDRHSLLTDYSFDRGKTTSLVSPFPLLRLLRHPLPNDSIRCYQCRANKRESSFNRSLWSHLKRRKGQKRRATFLLTLFGR